MPKTMIEKIWDAHAVREVPGESTILYIDRHLVHEMTSAQAFAGLRAASIPVRRPAATIAVLDHGVPTVPGRKMINVVDKDTALCITTLEQNARDFGFTLFDMADAGQGIVHIIGPEQGITLPGMTLVCGDSHTSTHGAMGALAFGIVQIGIVFAGINAEWYRAVIGLILLLAVMLNSYVRKLALEARR